MLASALLGARRPQEALETARDGLTIDPTQELLHRIRAAAFCQLKRFKEGQTAAEAALSLAPGSARARYLKALALAGRRRRRLALRAVEESLYIDPQDPDALRLMGVLKLPWRTETAEEWLRKSLALDPRNAWTLAQLGLTFQLQGRLADAELTCREALRIDPTSVWVKRRLRKVLLVRFGLGRVPIYGPLLARMWLLPYRTRLLVLGASLLLALGLMAADVAVHVLFWHVAPRELVPLLVVVMLITPPLLAWPISARDPRIQRHLTHDPELSSLFRSLSADKAAGRLEL